MRWWVNMAVSAAALASLAGCGGAQHQSARASVTAYVRDANAIERDLAPRFKDANRAYRSFSRGKLPPARAVTRLRGAQAAIAAARARVARLHPPAAARRLHALLVHFLGLNAGLARETSALAVYQRRSPAALKSLAVADRELRTRLQGATDRTEQAQALGDFSQALGHVLHALSSLTVPAIVAPAHRSQVRRLQTTRSLAAQLQQALDGQDAARVASLLVRFRRAGAAASSGDDLNAGAIAAYNRRFRRLNTAYSRVSREEIRLNRVLG
jgi:hypothetical protein